MAASVLYGVPGGKTREDSCLYLILIERRKPAGRLSVRESPIKSIRSMWFEILKFLFEILSPFCRVQRDLDNEPRFRSLME